MNPKINPRMHMTPLEFARIKEVIQNANQKNGEAYRRYAYRQLNREKPVIGIAGIYTTTDEDKIARNLIDAENITDMLENHGIEVDMPYRARTQKKIIANSTHILILRGQEPNQLAQEELKHIQKQNKKIITLSDLENIITTYSTLHKEQKRNYMS